MPEMNSFHMTSEEFRSYGRMVIDWIADYYEMVESLPVLSTVQPGEIRAALPEEPPQDGEQFEDVLQDFEKIILPGHNALAIAKFLRLFPSQHLGAIHSGRLAILRIGCAGYALDHQPGVH